MNPPKKKKRLPAWLRILAWLCVILLVLATPLLIVRRLMDNSHQRALALVKQGRAHPKASSQKTVAESSTQIESTTSHGNPVAELPLIGVFAGEDVAAQKELEQQLKEIRSFNENTYSDCRVDGVLSFRAVLAKMGIAVPDSMTEEEAAVEFLKQAERFSGILAQWKEAVGKGPWDYSSMETKDFNSLRGKTLNLAASLQRLLGAMAEARLRMGDTEGAWNDLQTMKSSGDRSGDILVTPMFWLSPVMFQTAHAGMTLGAWSETQLMEISTMMGTENAIASMRLQMDGDKLRIADYLTHFRENQAEIKESFSHSKSSIDRMINRIGIATVTDQQMADNIAVIQYQMDQPLTRFDTETGFYLGGSAGDSLDLPRSKPSDLSFDQFYYMYSERYSQSRDWVPVQIIRSQSEIDQTRIAAALEMQKRTTGGYPESLDAVSESFGNSIPRDIATGQPYFYQPDADGGYTLWGTGIDGKSDGGNEKNDVVWKHRPLKAK